MRWIFAVVSCCVLLAGCAPSVVRHEPPPATPAPAPVLPVLQLPAGWTTRDTAVLPLEYLSRNRSARMTLKQLTPLDGAKQVLDAERMCVLAQLSLQSKIAQRNDGRRIVHLPEALDGRNRKCCYVYTDGALLRRVVVFRSGEKYFESEMEQSAPDILLSRLADDQSSLLDAVLHFLEDPAGRH